MCQVFRVGSLIAVSRAVTEVIITSGRLLRAHTGIDMSLGRNVYVRACLCVCVCVGGGTSRMVKLKTFRLFVGLLVTGN
jgi:hypothetical protein